MGLFSKFEFWDCLEGHVLTEVDSYLGCIFKTGSDQAQAEMQPDVVVDVD